MLLKWLVVALLLPSPSGFSFELDSSGCLTSFDANSDYYAPEVRAMTSSQSTSPATVQFANDFSIQYFYTYKVLRNLRNGEVYILHQCGADNVYHDLPADAVNASIYQVPVTKWSTGSTIPIAFLRELGLGPLAVLVDDSYMTDDCMQKLVGCGAVGAQTPDDPTWANNAVAAGSTVHFTDDWGTGATSTAIDVKFDASSDPGPLHRAEWVKFVGAFFNLEAHANRVFAEIQSQYVATTALAAAAVDGGADAPRTIWVSFSAGYTWDGTAYPASWKLSMAEYKTDLVAAAGGTNIVASQVDPGCSASAYGPDYSCTVAGMKETLKLAEVVIDESFAPDNTFTLTNFLTNFNIAPDETGKYPFLVSGRMLRFDKSMVQSSQYTFGSDWFEAAIVKPHVVLEDMVSYMHPTVLPSYESHFFRNVAAGEAVVLVTAATCDDPFMVCPGETAPPAPPVDSNHCLYTLCLIAGPPPPTPLHGGTVVKAVLTASGTTDDYTPEKERAIAQVFADALAVEVHSVSVDVAAGSVIITVTITMPDASAATSASTLLGTSLASASAASSFLSAAGVTVEAVEPVVVEVLVLAPPDASSGLSTGGAVGIGVCAGLAGLLLVALGIVVAKEKQGNPLFYDIKVQSVR